MRILVSTDGSEFSRAAAEKCCQIIASPDKTAIKIVSVFEVVEPMDISISPEFSQELEEGARQQAEEFSAQTAAIIRQRFPDSKIDLTIQVSRSSAPDRVLIEAAKEWAADIIVIGSHGRGFWGRMLLGSITDSLVHYAPCSVLVVRKTG
jgi:nucleotide-binding universal stress UspA family protein